MPDRPDPPEVEFDEPEEGEGRIFALAIIATVSAAFLLAWLAGRGLKGR